MDQINHLQKGKSPGNESDQNSASSCMISFMLFGWPSKGENKFILFSFFRLEKESCSEFKKNFVPLQTFGAKRVQIPANL